MSLEQEFAGRQCSNEQSLEQVVRAAATAAKEASSVLALSSLEQRNHALEQMAAALQENKERILVANEADMAAARQAGTKESLLDRLFLDEARIDDMASALLDLVKLDDPLGRVLENRALYNGMNLKRVTVPLGVVAVIYEARPNVTVDAAGICLKSGNAVVLRGGSLAVRSTGALWRVLSKAAERAGLPASCIVGINSTDHAATDALMQLHGLVDVLVPRGGAGLIAHCVECSKVPVIETGTGNCHVYVHESADLTMARDIVMNAKTRRYGVCNAEESLLVDASVADEFLPMILPSLAEKGVLVHADAPTLAIAKHCGVSAVQATEADWATEYLGPEIAVRVMGEITQAIAHINKYGTKHSEAIVATDAAAIEAFQLGVDAACVYVNASTAFTDGGQFGLGAEIGISTQKLHVRGPFALEGLTSYKYLLTGTGQTRA